MGKTTEKTYYTSRSPGLAPIGDGLRRLEMGRQKGASASSYTRPVFPNVDLQGEIDDFDLLNQVFWRLVSNSLSATLTLFWFVSKHRRSHCPALFRVYVYHENLVRKGSVKLAS